MALDGAAVSCGETSGGLDFSDAGIRGRAVEGEMIDGRVEVPTVFRLSTFSVPGRPKTEKSAAIMIAAAITPSRR
jgi:hypothetical protein